MKRVQPLELLSAVALFTVALALRLHDIGRYGLWYDEIFSAEIARLPSLALIARTANDVHPPLYYLALRAWNLLTGSEADGTMRTLSALIDLCGIAATGLLAMVVFKQRWVAWFAMTLHALSPYAILYSQELRMYSLLLLGSTLSMAAMVKLKETSSRPWLGVYVVATTCALYTHMFAVFLVIAQAAWFVVFSRVSSGLSRARWFGLSVAMALIYSPWAWVITRQMLWAKEHRANDTWWIPKPPLKALVGVIHVFLGTDWVALAVGAVLLGLAVVLLVRWRRDALERDVLFGAAIVVALPIAIAFVVSHVTTPVFVARFFTEVLPSLWLLLLLPIVRLPRTWMRVVAGALFLLAGVRAIPGLNYEHSFKAPTPYREIVAELALASPPLVLIDDTVSTEAAWRWYSTLLDAAPTAVKSPRVFGHDKPPAPLPDSTAAAVVLWISTQPAPEALLLEGGATLPLTSSVARGSFALRSYGAAPVGTSAP